MNICLGLSFSSQRYSTLYFQTQNQAEKKIRESKREAILKEASDSEIEDLTTIQDNLAVLDLVKPRPYGTLQAVGNLVASRVL